jgi:glucoamylase
MSDGLTVPFALAGGYVVRNSPVTQQDRWEMDLGYSPFTLAVEIAALLVAANLADVAAEPQIATYLRETADTWNACIERWTYVTEPETAEAASPRHGFVPIKGRSPEQSIGPVAYIVGPDALALVRFGLRAPDDPRIINTITFIDAVLKVDTPYGPAWRRYV